MFSICSYQLGAKPMVTRRRPDGIDNPGPLLAIMRTCRQAMISASTAVRPTGAAYQGLGAAVAAIDTLAALLTGRQDYFWAVGGGATAAQREQMAADQAMESGRQADEIRSSGRQP
jgi:hypothetical protein